MDNLHAYEQSILARIIEQCGTLEAGGMLRTVAPALDALGVRDLHKLLPAVFLELPDGGDPSKVGRRVEEEQEWRTILVVPKAHPTTNQPYTGTDIGQMIGTIIQALQPPWKPDPSASHLMDYRGRKVVYNELGWVEIPIVFACKADIPFLSATR